MQYLQRLMKGSSAKKKYAPRSLQMIESFWKYLIYLEKPEETMQGGGNISNWIIF